jgi:chromosome segregation ATPase
MESIQDMGNTDALADLRALMARCEQLQADRSRAAQAADAYKAERDNALARAERLAAALEEVVSAYWDVDSRSLDASRAALAAWRERGSK